jgi:hypothetical protein
MVALAAFSLGRHNPSIGRSEKIMKKITKRLVIRNQTIRDLSLREVRGGAVVLDTEPCGTSIARGRCVAPN